MFDYVFRFMIAMFVYISEGRQCQWYPVPEEFVRIGQQYCKAVGFASSPAALLSVSYAISPLIRLLYRKELNEFFSTYSQTAEFFRRIIESNRTAVQQGADPNEKWIYYLVNELNKEDFGLDMSESLRNYCVFLFGGITTNYQNITAVMYCLAKHPEVQEECRTEVQAVRSDDKVGWSEAILRRLKLLDGCINEALRLYHPTSVTNGKKTSREVEFNGIAIPEGCFVVPCIASMHRHPNNYENPTSFDPHRWLKPSSSQLSKAFKPFWAGPRVCSGRQLAIVSTKILIMTILEKYELRLPNESPYHNDLPLTASFFDSLPEIKIEFKKRQ